MVSSTHHAPAVGCGWGCPYAPEPWTGFPCDRVVFPIDRSRSNP